MWFLRWGFDDFVNGFVDALLDIYRIMGYGIVPNNGVS